MARPDPRELRDRLRHAHQAGDRVEVQAAGRRLVGTVENIRPNTLALVTDRRVEVVRLRDLRRVKAVA